MSKRSSDASGSEGSSNKKAAIDNTLEGLDGAKFLETAHNLTLLLADEAADEDEIGDEVANFVVEPKVFTTQGYGWHINGKSFVTIVVDGVERKLPVNITMNINVAKSKPKKEKD